MGGCTLTGALAVTTGIKDSVTIIHGPPGCAHHNFSLLHATMLDNGCMNISRVLSSGMNERDVIFGGEKALITAIKEAESGGPAIIFILSTCVSETIGDDVMAIARESGSHVCVVPTGGFLGGDFETGFSRALIAVSNLAEPGYSGNADITHVDGSINLVGEKNLESEVEPNYREVKRLLSWLGLAINIRFSHNITRSDIDRLPLASANILREPALAGVGEHLISRFKTPYINSFPLGIRGTLSFIGSVAERCGIPADEALTAEKEYQRDIMGQFSDLRGRRVQFQVREQGPVYPLVHELVSEIGMRESQSGTLLPVPYPYPVGTSGIKRMLHLWRRTLSCRVA